MSLGVSVWEFEQIYWSLPQKIRVEDLEVKEEEEVREAENGRIVKQFYLFVCEFNWLFWGCTWQCSGLIPHSSLLLGTKYIGCQQSNIVDHKPTSTYYTILYCTVLCYATLCYTTLHYTILYHIFHMIWNILPDKCTSCYKYIMC